MSASGEAESPSEFRTLLRTFNRQFLENELTSAEGNPQDTMVHIVSLFAAASVCLSLIFVVKYCFGLSAFSWERRAAISWADREFLISLSMAITSFVTVLSWDSLFPTPRDCVILGSLPVRMRTVLTAKATSILFLAGCATAAANGFTSIAFPWVLLNERFTLLLFLRYLGAHVLVVSAAGLFAFFSLLAIQGVLINILSYRAFLRLSAWIQLGILLLILSLFFMMPDIAYPQELAKPANFRLARWLPPLWFVGLYQVVLGGGSPVAAVLAGLARDGLAAAALLAFLTYAAGYLRHVQKVLEQQEAPPHRRGLLPDPVGWFGRMWRDPIAAGVFGFVSRTMLRNRQHRVLLALYSTVGLGYVFEGLGALVKGGASEFLHPSAQATSVPLIFSFFLFLGMRVLFAVPVEPKANWIFRLTETDRPDRYLGGVRKVMLVFGVIPVAMAPMPLYGLLWGWNVALRHVTWVLLIQFLMTERLLKDFQKIPFTCSMVPGKANLKVKFAFYWTAFAVTSFVVTRFETWLLRQPLEFYLVPTVILGGCLGWQIFSRRLRERAIPGFIYEDRPEWAFERLNLQQ